uniref:Uncharacterized protein n=1 Tax=Chromera velia CCMP2878 TaxID=1169474 RepID=A0A0K6S977_9ALVE|eukprot:Cvel_26976.t1-p1 / transcript=Cvel_26976.t1 / gene=Cvel_26976 / organism=Chromera_velia_CCMP2878 / gene_product=hypothetical protein / transcript_product=hypothetical protein / location=Cvel_scaffold3292:9864-11186(+) / protein_length=280 / sequence_SO=supercontig / SO=protein_coding / is_pseudo=false
MKLFVATVAAAVVGGQALIDTEKFNFGELGKLDFDVFGGAKGLATKKCLTDLWKGGKCVPTKGPYADTVPIQVRANFGETKTIFSTDFFDIELQCNESTTTCDDGGDMTTPCWETLLVYKEKFGGTVSVIVNEDDGSQSIVGPNTLPSCGDLDDDEDGLYTVNSTMPNTDTSFPKKGFGGPRVPCVLSDNFLQAPTSNDYEIDEDNEAFITLSNGISAYISAEDGHFLWVAPEASSMAEFNSNCGIFANLGVKVPKGQKFSIPAIDMKYMDDGEETEDKK